LDRGLLIDAEYCGMLWRVQVQPDDVSSLALKSGSSEAMYRSSRCGLSRCLAQTRATIM
jgi:hypothetical protein